MSQSLKTYEVYADYIQCVTTVVQAESEEEAIQIAKTLPQRVVDAKTWGWHVFRGWPAIRPLLARRVDK